MGAILIWGKPGFTTGARSIPNVEANISKLAEAADSYGFINIQPDPDGTLRHALLIARYQRPGFLPFA